MDNIIPIQKNIYSSNKFREVIDTRFSELFNTQLLLKIFQNS